MLCQVRWTLVAHFFAFSQAARYLLGEGADINAVNAQGCTPLMLAVIHNAVEVCPLLVI